MCPAWPPWWHVWHQVIHSDTRRILCPPATVSNNRHSRMGTAQPNSSPTRDKLKELFVVKLSKKKSNKNDVECKKWKCWHMRSEGRNETVTHEECRHDNNWIKCNNACTKLLECGTFNQIASTAFIDVVNSLSLQNVQVPNKFRNCV